MQWRLATNPGLAWMLLFTALSAGGREIYVSPDGGNISPYTNWADAATEIQWAVNVATNGETVWVSNGTYVLTNQITMNRYINIIGTGGVAVVDGNNTVRCFYASVDIGVMRNFLITRGLAGGANVGGGASLYGVTLSDCTFVSNQAYRGGGIFLYNGPTTVRDCAFIANNSSDDGGGFYSFAVSSVVENCVFSNNVSSVMGGGGAWRTGAYPAVRDCRFYGNTALSAAGAYVTAYSSRFENCVFETNTALSSGGGLSVYDAEVVTGCEFLDNSARMQGGGIYATTTLAALTTLVANCSFTGNTVYSNTVSAGGGGYLANNILVSNCYASDNEAFMDGGGFNMVGGAMIRNCRITGNRTVINTGNYGGAGVSMRVSAKHKIWDSVITSNSSGRYGGGIFLETGGAIQNCLIANNTALTGGGGIYFRNVSGTSLVSSCTIASNDTSNAGGGINDNSASTVLFVENSIIYFNTASLAGSSNYYVVIAHTNAYTNCCLAPELTGFSATYSTNNLTVNPGMAAPESGNYRLSRGSPCINAGVNRAWMTGALDLDGRPRLDKFNRLVDMGCYESVAVGSMYTIH